MDDIDISIRTVEQQIKDTEAKITKVENEIKLAESKAEGAADQGDRSYWRKKEEHLRKEKEDLRKKEEHLRKEKEDLRKKEEQLRDERKRREEQGTRTTDLPPFDVSKYKVTFPELEVNDVFLSMQGRVQQVQQLKKILDNLKSASKHEIVVLSTARGMGKTFFLKKVVFEDIDALKQARQVGRIISTEAQNCFTQFIGANVSLFDNFWQCLIAHHLVGLFRETKVNGVNFRYLSLTEVLRIKTQLIQSNQLEQLIHKITSSHLSEAVQLLMEYTNSAFNTKNTSKPVFLLDNAHVFARQFLQDRPSTLDQSLNHTLLSSLLSLLGPSRIPCIVACTNDGKLDILAEYSNIRPRYIRLTPLTFDEIDKMGMEMIGHFNEENKTSVQWKPLAQHDQDDRIVVICHSCQIPRFVKIGITSWYDGQKNLSLVSSWMDDFFITARDYYSDACLAIMNYSVDQFALLLLSCHVSLITTTVPGTTLLWKDLTTMSLVFPYNDNYVIPIFLWERLDREVTGNHNWEKATIQAVTDRWNAVNEKITLIVPGISLSDLTINPQEWWSLALNNYNMGIKWEKLLCASLATQYQLISPPPGQYIQLSKIYQMTTSQSNSQTKQLLDQIFVNFQSGVISPNTEQFGIDDVLTAVISNRKCHNAHHDIILHARPRNVTVQCKNSLSAPEPSDIIKQLNTCPLLWFFPGLQVDGVSPKKYRVDEVVNAMNEGRLAFLSGAGCVSPMNMRLLQSFKQIVRAISSIVTTSLME